MGTSETMLKAFNILFKHALTDCFTEWFLCEKLIVLFPQPVRDKGPPPKPAEPDFHCSIFLTQTPTEASLIE